MPNPLDALIEDAQQPERTVLDDAADAVVQSAQIVVGQLAVAQRSFSARCAQVGLTALVGRAATDPKLAAALTLAQTIDGLWPQMFSTERPPLYADPIPPQGE